MTDRDALHRAILESPGDDVPRLVFADYLDDTGRREDADRAEFIRLQCQLERDPTNPNASAQLERCNAILRKWGAGWLPPMGREAAYFIWDVQGSCTIKAGSYCPGYYTFYRGFIESVIVDVEDGLPSQKGAGDFVRQILAAHPVQSIKIRLRDMEPDLELRFAHSAGRFSWYAMLVLHQTYRDETETIAIDTLDAMSRREMVAKIGDYFTTRLAKVQFRPKPQAPIPF